MECTWERAIFNLIMGNEEGLIRDPAVKDHLGDSDHNVMEFQKQFESEHHRTKLQLK